MGDAQVQFTLVVPADTYEHMSDGGIGRMRMDKVLAAFQEGQFLLPHAVQLPLARIRVDPITPEGVWLGEKTTMII